jgi:hypothetical protein
MLDEQTKHNVRVHLNAAMASIETAMHYANGDRNILYEVISAKLAIENAKESAYASESDRRD